MVGRSLQRRAGPQDSAVPRTDGRGARDGHRGSGVDGYMVGGRSRTTFKRTCHHIIARGGRMCRGRTAQAVAPLIRCCRTRCCQRDDIRATGCSRTSDGDRWQGIYCHISRGCCCTTIATGSRHGVLCTTLRSCGDDCTGIFAQTVAPLIRGGTRCRHLVIGGSHTRGVGAIVAKGNCGKRFHIHECRSRGRTTVRARTRNGVLGFACRSSGDCGRGTTAQTIAPHIRRCSCSSHRCIGSYTRGIDVVAITTAVSEGNGGSIRCELNIIIESRVIVMLHINSGLIVIGGRGLGDLEIRYQFGFGCGRNLRDTVTTDRCRIGPRGRTAVIKSVGITR